MGGYPPMIPPPNSESFPGFSGMPMPPPEAFYPMNPSQSNIGIKIEDKG